MRRRAFVKNGAASVVACLALAVLGALTACGAEGNFPPICNPQPVVKPVKVVRREIKVSIIGEERMFKPKDLKWDVQAVIDYWYEAMDREIGNKPDLVVLPEGIDNWRDATPAEKRDWKRVCGDRFSRRCRPTRRSTAATSCSIRRASSPTDVSRTPCGPWTATAT